MAILLIWFLSFLLGSIKGIGNPLLQLTENEILYDNSYWVNSGKLQVDAVNIFNKVTTAYHSDSKKAVCFSSTSCVEVKMNINPSIYNKLSIEVYVYLRSIARTYAWIISSDNGNYDRSIVIYDNRFAPSGYSYGVGQGVGHSYSSLSPCNNNQWYHIVATWDKSSSIGVLYRNFYEMSSTYLSNDDGQSSFCLNTNPLSESYSIDGCIASIRIWNETLNLENVRDLYSNFSYWKNPTSSPTNSPIKSPTLSPTNIPTVTPTNTPTFFPTASPTNIPTITPTNTPTLFPTTSPTKIPVIPPTISPVVPPTNIPSTTPTNTPTFSPTTFPTTAQLFNFHTLQTQSISIIILLFVSILIATILFYVSLSHTIVVTISKLREIHGMLLIKETWLLMDSIEKISIFVICSDIITDLFFSIKLISTMHQKSHFLYIFGCILFITGVLGIILGGIKFMIIRKLYGKIDNIKKQLKIPSNRIKIKNHINNIRDCLFDIIMFDLIIGSVEDIPQVVIIIMVMIVFDIYTYISLIALSTSIASILWKIIRYVLNRGGCHDGFATGILSLNDEMELANHHIEGSMQNQQI